MTYSKQGKRLAREVFSVQKQVWGRAGGLGTRASISHIRRISDDLPLNGFKQIAITSNSFLIPLPDAQVVPQSVPIAGPQVSKTVSRPPGATLGWTAGPRSACREALPASGSRWREIMHASQWSHMQDPTGGWSVAHFATTPSIIKLCAWPGVAAVPKVKKKGSPPNPKILKRDFWQPTHHAETSRRAHLRNHLSGVPDEHPTARAARFVRRSELCREALSRDAALRSAMRRPAYLQRMMDALQRGDH